jgi:hypothetical protein
MRNGTFTYFPLSFMLQLIQHPQEAASLACHLQRAEVHKEIIRKLLATLNSLPASFYSLKSPYFTMTANFYHMY